MDKIRFNPLITCQENDKCIWVFNLPFAGFVKGYTGRKVGGLFTVDIVILGPRAWPEVSSYCSLGILQ